MGPEQLCQKKKKALTGPILQFDAVVRASEAAEIPDEGGAHRVRVEVTVDIGIVDLVGLIRRMQRARAARCKMVEQYDGHSP